MIKNKVFKNIFFTFLSIIILYTIIATILVGYKSKQLLLMSNNRSNELYLNEVSKILDYKIGLALKFTDKISELDSVYDYLLSSKPNYLFTTNIYNNLNNSLTSSDELGFTVGITKLTDNFVISSAGSFSYENYLESIDIDKYSLAYLDKLFINKSSNSTYYPIPEIYTSEDSKYLTIVRQKNYIDSPDSLYYFITFDKANLLPNTLPKNKGIFSLFSKDVISSYKSKSYENVNLDINEIITSKLNDNLVITETKNKDMLYSIKSKSLEEISYNYMLKKNDLTPLDFTLISSLLTLNISLLFLGIIVIYFASKKNYLPIQNILNAINSDVNMSDNNDNISKAEKFDDLEYIINTINTINNVNSNLKLTLNDSLFTLQENFFRHLIYDLVVYDDIQKSILDLKLDKYINGGILCIFSLDYKEEITYNNIISFQSRLLSLFINEIDFFSIPLDNKRHCLIFIEKDSTIINNHLHNTITTLEEDLSINITYAISNSVNTIIDFKIAFNEASELISKKCAYIDTRVINISPNSSIEQQNYYYPINTENLLINYINSHDLTKALSVLKIILDKNLIDMNLDDNSITELKYALINSIRRILNQNNKSIRDFINLNPILIDNFNSCTSYNLHEVSIDLFTILFKTYIDNDTNLDNPLVRNMLIYIQDNFNKDISLTTISEQFKLSEGYISKLLKSTANINFKNYVNTLKISKSKELLSTGKYKVNEVSKMVGCDNPNTFIRMFKKHEGISPGEFTKLN